MIILHIYAHMTMIVHLPIMTIMDDNSAYICTYDNNSTPPRQKLETQLCSCLQSKGGLGLGPEHFFMMMIVAVIIFMIMTVIMIEMMIIVLVFMIIILVSLVFMIIIFLVTWSQGLLS